MDVITATNSTQFSTGGSHGLDVISQIMGWVYFLAWAVCFYPQIYENWKRKSVVGYSFDFFSLDSIDLSLYTAYNVGLLAFSSIQEEYKKKHETEVIPVKINDLVFSAHGVLCCTAMFIQAMFYERGDQKVSKTCRILAGVIFTFATCMLIVTAAGSLQWVDFLTYLSYVKIFTTTKYIPQVYMNFKRKSTSGFSIGLALCDITGGSFSVGQMIVSSYYKNDWSSFAGNPTKFGVGVVSVIFDIVLISQHFSYRKNVPRGILTESSAEDANNGEV